MQHTEELVQVEFIKRYKRFFADVRLPDGSSAVAHVPNTGSLKGCLHTGHPCLISSNDNPARKLKHTLHFLGTPNGGWVGVNTTLPNALVFEAWENKLIPAWRAYGFGRREFKISPESRLDLVLAIDDDHFERRQKLHHIEVKNVSYVEDKTALFPDAITTRGQKHLRDLMNLIKAGHTAELVFVIQREDCTAFAPADGIDPEYGQLLRQARDEGVIITALSCAIDPLAGVTLLTQPLALRF